MATISFIDTHCHIHDSEYTEKYGKSPEELFSESCEAGIAACICVGTDVRTSEQAVELAQKLEGCYSSIAIHPHEATEMTERDLVEQIATLTSLATKAPNRLVAVGECGLDYYYPADASVQNKQKTLFLEHLKLARTFNLPLIFHIRDAFDDFFKILDDFGPLTGVVHSFSADADTMQQVVTRGLYCGLNGIMTFTKDERQLAAARTLPLERMLLETDAPFLTPKPFRGTMNESKYIREIAEFLAVLRGESVEQIAAITTENGKKLFNIV